MVSGDHNFDIYKCGILKKQFLTNLNAFRREALENTVYFVDIWLTIDEPIFVTKILRMLVVYPWCTRRCI